MRISHELKYALLTSKYSLYLNTPSVSPLSAILTVCGLLLLVYRPQGFNGKL